MEISKSKRINQKYIIQSEIGKGGMARVYLAIHKSSGKKVAIKVLELDPRNSTAKLRFKEEMKLVQEIKDTHIVKFYEGHYDAHEQYIVMEYVDGQMLKSYINAKTRLPIETTVNFAIQISSGFQAIHNYDIVHRDLKSTNIMLNSSNTIKIIDFGIAQGHNTPRMTEVNKIIGSVQYMAPEIVAKAKASVRSDIYSMGILIYEMLVGKTPFGGSKPLEVALMHQNSKIAPVNEVRRDVPQSLANIIIKATAKDPSKRYGSFNELRADLETSLRQDRVAEKKLNVKKIRNGTNTTMPSFFKSNLFFGLVIGGVILIAIIIVLVLLFT